jgi:hypothetical protein
MRIVISHHDAAVKALEIAWLGLAATPGLDAIGPVQTDAAAVAKAGSALGWLCSGCLPL